MLHKLPDEIDDMALHWYYKIMAYNNAKSEGLEQKRKLDQQKAETMSKLRSNR